MAESQVRTLLLVCALMLMTSCMVKPTVLTTDEVQNRVTADREMLSHDYEPITRPINLYEAMARALRYNLDAKVKAMQAALAHQQLNVSNYALLPQLAANAGYDGRNNFVGSAGRSLITGRQLLEPFTSSDKNIFTGNLALSWDILDFGLSYVRAKQAGDNMLIAEEEKRRIAVRLLQEVRSAYWRSVSAERLLPQIQALDSMVGKALSQAQTIYDKKLQTPLSPLNYRRDMLNIQREVQKLYRELVTAKFQLAALMGLPPGSQFQVEQLSSQETDPIVNLNIEVLEKQALVFRPELRTIDYQKRINAKEAKATLLELFPSMKLQFGGFYNSNSFLLYQNWLNYAAQISWNLLGVFRVPAKYKAIEAHGKVLEAQSMALTMTIITEIHVGAAQFLLAKDELNNAKQYRETQHAITEHTKSLWLTNSTNDLTLMREKMNHILAEARVDVAQAGTESAYATLRAAVGEEAVPPAIEGQNIAALTEAVRRLWEPTTSTGIGQTEKEEAHASLVAR